MNCDRIYSRNEYMRAMLQRQGGVSAKRASEFTVRRTSPLIRPAGGQDFHKYPDQEEVIYVLEGEIEQWVDREKRILRPGDSAFIGAGVVHASGFWAPGRQLDLMLLESETIDSKRHR